ncbi:3,4-dihydroxy-2-butanone 4-phosphate synthase [Candidatus Photodesmus blepharus]|uniref:3,4-dihydroxy-2-butanone 4-phosphate synthase n=2 Tax=Candidatus Photodesmus blepharonis TaxID=1179155 RepID=A0A084CP78_9GAMM|nr:3,4-dihydroxy-2-butanone 4-phosphate synthase [Candidatus Photodesmus blepharus]
MARRPDLELFAEKHNIKLGTISDLIEYRNNTETTIERVGGCQLPTEFGQFELIVFRDTIDSQIHYALKKGNLMGGAPLVRVHLQDTFTDLLRSGRNVDAECVWTIDKAMKRIGEEGGILVILGNEESADLLLHRVRFFAQQDEGKGPMIMAKQRASRRVGVGSQILSNLGVSDMRLLSSTQNRYHALGGFGLNVVEYITV